MKVQMYALLKEYFDPVLEVSDDIQNAEQLKQQLVLLQPKALPVLNSCRFAVDDCFIDAHFKFSSHDIISIIPPSSGG
jgi:hypothetical protein